MKTDRQNKLIILIIILLIAGFFRLHKLTTYPLGLFPDEAANGIDAQTIIDGIHSPFFERGNGREALYFYLIAGSFSIFGEGVWQIHLVSALLGILAVLGIYLVAKEWFNYKIGYLSSLLVAISVPAIVMSRVGFRSVLLTVTATYFFYFTTLALRTDKTRRQRMIMAGLAGLLFGLNWYTYIAARILAGVVLVLFILAVFITWRLKEKNFAKKYYHEILIGLSSFFVTFLPLLIYFIKHPKSFVGRASNVSIFNPDLNGGNILATVWLNFKDTLRMFITDGDLNWRHNVSGDGWFEPLTAVLFYVALIYFLLNTTFQLYLLILKRRQVNKRQLAINLAIMGWFLGALVPMIVTAEGIPHFLRAQGIIPIVYVLPAWLIWQIAVWLREKKYLSRRSINTALVILAIYLTASSYNTYFVKAYNNPKNYYAFRSDLTIVSNYINERQDTWHTYLVLDEFSVQTIKFLTYHQNLPYRLVKPEEAYKWNYENLRQIAGRQKVVIFTQSTIFDTIKFKSSHPEARLIKQEKNRWGEIIMEVYELETQKLKL